MVKQEIYLDNNATTKPLADVRHAMVEVLEEVGNASSAHTCGDWARDHLRRARSAIASLIGADPDTIVFTSGGTEANNMALFSAKCGAKDLRCRIITTSVEHSSILKMAEYLQLSGADVKILSVAPGGQLDLEELDRELTPSTSLVSIQWVNNETGVVQPIELIGEMCQRRGVLFHTDACQAVGKLTINVRQLPIDFLTATAHKLHGPQGVGALYAKNAKPLQPFLRGGPQEFGLRAGTENLPGIVGFGKAAEIRGRQFEHAVDRLRQLRDRFEQHVLENIASVTVNGGSSQRVCNSTNLCFHGIDGQALVARLDQEGVRCSQSSACTNQRPEPSYVLRAMGLSEEEAYSSVRFSFGVFNTEDEVQAATAKISKIVKQLRSFANNFVNPHLSART